MQNKETLPQQYQDEEIDLFELASVLWDRKWLIIGITLVVIALATTYLVVTPKVYEVKVVVSETQATNLAQLNVGGQQLGGYAQDVSSDFAFALFQKKLDSRSLVMEYFKSNVEPVYRANGASQSANTLLDSVFLKLISVVKPSSQNAYLTVSMQYTDPRLAAEWLNGYLGLIEQKAKEELVESAKKFIALALDEHEQQITALRATYARSLQDKIIRLDEAYKIAKSLDIKRPMASAINGKERSSNLDESLLYIRGADVLGANIESLKSRKKIDPFISDIRPIQESINYLNSISYDVDALEVVNFDEWAYEPERSVKPKKMLVLVLAGLLGGMLGVFVALIQGMLSKRRHK